MKLIALTPGDPDGIGPEVTWKALQHGWAEKTPILCVGARAPFQKLGAPVVEFSPDQLRSPRTNRLGEPFVWLLPAPAGSPGFQAGWSIEQATRLVQKGTAQALVTGPISKERLQKGGYLYPGHTEFLAALCKTKHVTMMLANSLLRVTLVTTHLALKDVPKALTRTKIRRAVLQTADHLRDHLGISKPRIAVTALNPHAGEGGLFGREEISIIAPELRALAKSQGRRAEIIGPLPADTLFAKHLLAGPKDRYDAVVCMYHDQGLIPVKLLDFQKTVNVTLGLPIIRTSVDHGTGFEIAGKGIADPSSLESAIELAQKLIRNRGRK